MKFSLVFLGLFAIATAAPLAIRRAEHTTAGVVGGRDIQNGDMVRRSDNPPIQVVPAHDDSIKRKLGETLETRQDAVPVPVPVDPADILRDIVELVGAIIEAINEDNTVQQLYDFYQVRLLD